MADQHGCPTWSFELARMTAHVIGHIEELAEQNKCSLSEAALPVSGVYHATGSGETTWYGFAAQAITEWRKHRPDARMASVEPISTSDYPTPAKRPLNSRLDCSKLARTFNGRMPNWHDSLARVVAELAARSA